MVATLHPGGTAAWWQLPAGWNIVAADVYGTVLSSTATGRLQLARLPLARPNDPSPVTATTVTGPTISAATPPGSATASLAPTSPETCDPADHNDRQVLPLRRCDVGFGVVWVRNAFVARGLLDADAHPAAPAELTSVVEDAVRRFQLDEGLDVEGLVGPQTWFALYPEYLDGRGELAELDEDGDGRIEPDEVWAMGDSNAPCEPTVEECATDRLMERLVGARSMHPCAEGDGGGRGRGAD